MRCLVFDLDGTLLNTLGDLGNACNYILEKYHYPLHSRDAYKQMVGNGFKKLLRRALPQGEQFDDSQIDAFVSEAKAWYGEHMTEDTRPYPGMPEALTALKNVGVILAVLTNKPHELGVPLIRHYFPKISFAQIIGQRPDKPLKPNPTVLLEMLKEMNVSPDEAGYVGDSDVDMFTAHNAEVMGIGAAWGFRGAEELEKAKADAILAEPAELAGLF